jgi:putative SOS response-associated peptidase YedK
MCGRFVQCATGERLAARFQLATPPGLAPRYNVAPSQPVGAIRSAGGGREWVLLRWGLVPAWAPEPRTA